MTNEREPTIYEACAEIARLRKVHEGGDGYLNRALHILHLMSLERTGWRGFLRRWHISADPLRVHAARLLDEIGIEYMRPMGTERTARPKAGSDSDAK